MKQRCYVCEDTKELEDFPKDRSRPNGRASRCRKCNAKRVNEYTKTPKGKARGRVYYRMRAYGLTEADFDSMLAKQEACCAICRRDFAQTQRKYPYVDHDHKTGKVRALLCGTCNSGLGLFSESSAFLRAAAEYLENHR